MENAKVVGAHLLAGLQEMAKEFTGLVSNVRGRGLFLAFDLPDKGLRDRTLAACLDQGLIGPASGAAAIRFRPSLALSKDEADEGVSKLRLALAAARSHG